MKKLLPLLLIAVVLGGLFFTSCKKDEGCIDENNKWSGQCPNGGEAVCGCDNKTYFNSCYASREGVMSWTGGECD